MHSEISYINDHNKILAAIYDLIQTAQESIILQMYLFANNGDQTFLLPRNGALPHAKKICQWLIDKKNARPDINIIVILDTNTPANPKLTRRKGILTRQLLKQAGIIVLNANLFATNFDPRQRILPAKNFHLNHHNISTENWVERQNRWQILHNVEDHRKNMVIDSGRVGMITSHNFFDIAYDWHENLFWFTGKISRQLWSIATSSCKLALQIPQQVDKSELKTIYRLLDRDINIGLKTPLNTKINTIKDNSCYLVENEAIRSRLMALFSNAKQEDRVLIATTYFSDLAILDILHQAAKRGVHIRILIDSIDGLPLPTIASWLTRNMVNHRVIQKALQIQANIPTFEFRVHNSSKGVMMHLKTAVVISNQSTLFGGQANYTPNSFSGAWLETNIETQSPVVIDEFITHFENLWTLPQSKPIQPAKGSLGKIKIMFFLWLLKILAIFGIRP